jgi:hypothetical protein
MSTRNERLSLALTGILVLCALVVTILVVRHELVRQVAKPNTEDLPRSIENWRHLSRDGQHIGPLDASVHLVEYFD